MGVKRVTSQAELGLPATNQPKTAAGVALTNDQQHPEGEA